MNFHFNFFCWWEWKTFEVRMGCCFSSRGEDGEVRSPFNVYFTVFAGEVEFKECACVNFKPCRRIKLIYKKRLWLLFVCSIKTYTQIIEYRFMILLNSVLIWRICNSYTVFTPQWIRTNLLFICVEVGHQWSRHYKWRERMLLLLIKLLLK